MASSLDWMITSPVKCSSAVERSRASSLRELTFLFVSAMFEMCYRRDAAMALSLRPRQRSFFFRALAGESTGVWASFGYLDMVARLFCLSGIPMLALKFGIRES